MRFPTKKISSENRTNLTAIMFVSFISLDMLEHITSWVLSESYCNLIFDIFRLLIVFCSLIIAMRRKSVILNLLRMVIGVGTVIFLSLWVNPSLQFMLREIIVLFAGTCVPALALGMCVCGDNRKVLSYSKNMLPLVYIYICGNILLEDLAYVYQNTAYAILFFAMITLAIYVDEHKKSMLIHYIILLSTIIYLGARGALLCIVLWTAFLFYHTDKKKIRRYMTVFGLVLLFILYMAFWEDLITWLYSLVPGSRIIARLYRGNFWVSGRTELYIQCYEELKNRWLTFGGMMADRFYLVDTFKNTSKLGFFVEEGNYQSIYAHNILFEVCFCFGNILGMIIICFLIYKIALIYTKAKNQGTHFLWVCIVLIGFVPLWFSGSFWSRSFFWIMVGYISMNRRFKY